PRLLGLRRGGVQQALVVLLGGPAGYVKHEGAAGVVRAAGRVFQAYPGPASQKFERLGKADTLELLNKAQDVAVFIGGPAAVALPARVDVEGRAAVVVEGAQALVGPAGGAEGQVAADHLYDVVGLLDLLDPVVCQGPPVFRRTRWCGGKKGRGCC